MRPDHVSRDQQEREWDRVPRTARGTTDIRWELANARAAKLLHNPAVRAVIVSNHSLGSHGHSRADGREAMGKGVGGKPSRLHSKGELSEEWRRGGIICCASANASR